MSMQNSIKGGNTHLPSYSGKFFTSLNNNELKELMLNNALEDIYYLISDSYLNGLDLSLLKYEELSSELKIKNLNQRNKLFKFINSELAEQRILNWFNISFVLKLKLIIQFNQIRIIYSSEIECFL